MTETRAGDVLLVDDSLMNIRLLAEMLKTAGYHARAATSGRRALETIRAHPPELVLLDINMPEMDGYQVCEALKADPATREIPIIFISAHDAPIEKVKAFKAGGVDYVTKPFEAEEVLARVATHLSVWRLQRETQARKAELERALLELQKAQEKIARLSSSTAGMLEDPAAWSRTLSAEVAQAVGARAVGVFAADLQSLTPLSAEGIDPPELSKLWGNERPREMFLPPPSADPGAEASLPAEPPCPVLPVLGMTGDLRGVLVVVGKTGFLTEGERQILRSFAHHLGAALDLRRLREQLNSAEARRAQTRADMSARGVQAVDICPWCGRCTPHTLESASACVADGTPLDVTSLLPYRIQDRYRLVRRLGGGGMGTVYSATDERLQRHVALKVIRAELLHDVASRLRLSREAQTVARISHPGVVGLFDSGELEDGSHFLVMELLSGYDLEGTLQRYGRGRPAQVASLLRQAGAALAAAHRAGVVHRDVKPANLFLTPLPEGGFTVKVLDFGVALPMRASRLTSMGSAVGTPAYMSPEQAMGHDVDERTDVYSLAAAAFEAFTGRSVVRTEGGFGEIFVEIMTEKSPKVSDVLRGLPKEVDAVFEAGLARLADDRPRDVEAWSRSAARALEAVPARLVDVAGWPEGAPPPSQNP